MAQFTDKVVLITGASSGIGASTARSFSSLGAKLAIVGRNRERLQAVADECTEQSPSSLKPLCLVVEDLGIDPEVERVVKSTVDHYGKLDVLINNAGIWRPASIENTSLAQLDEHYKINVRSVYHMTMLAVPHLIKTKGNIVNVSSVAATKPIPGNVAYNLSKAAINSFTRNTAAELGPKGVRVNAVCPGFIRTEIHQTGGVRGGDYDKMTEQLEKSWHLLGRLGVPEDVARVITFLASEQAGLVTGSNMPVDAGCELSCPSLSI